MSTGPSPAGARASAALARSSCCRLAAHSSRPSRVAVATRYATRPVILAAVGPARMPGMCIPTRATPWPRSH
eukprot:11833648-Alexandrium_andersonii.AAC.1